MWNCDFWSCQKSRMGGYYIISLKEANVPNVLSPYDARSETSCASINGGFQPHLRIPCCRHSLLTGFSRVDIVAA